MSHPDRRSRFLAAVSAVLVCSLALPIAAQTPARGIDHRQALGEPNSEPLTGEALDEETDRVASLLRCVSCQGLSVAASPAPAAVAMKLEVRELLADGYDEEQILQYFEGGFGEFIRLAPKAEGFNLVVWLAPIAALLVGLLLVGMRIRGRRKAATASAEEEDLGDYVEQVRREVEE